MGVVLFYSFSGLAILTALFVILLPEPTRALLSLVLTMFSLSVLYVLLGAHFVAMANLIVYAGAVLVLFLFVIMLQGIGAKDSSVLQRFHPLFLFFAPIAAMVLLAGMTYIISGLISPPAREVSGTVEAVGKLLFTDYILPFELTSFLLLVSVFAAVALAKKEKGEA
ncbi:MAG: NADH-quinone oxidoreductase subunit J [Candidatus Omnitrophota bacterium]|nr:NADH-quinone oxidoreductase subunit J [Candidatus Omnitrophota bacterium]